MDNTNKILTYIATGKPVIPQPEKRVTLINDIVINNARTVEISAIQKPDVVFPEGRLICNKVGMYFVSVDVDLIGAEWR